MQELLTEADSVQPSITRCRYCKPSGENECLPLGHGTDTSFREEELALAKVPKVMD